MSIAQLLWVSGLLLSQFVISQDCPTTEDNTDYLTFQSVRTHYNGLIYADHSRDLSCMYHDSMSPSRTMAPPPDIF
jgi:hypothetical protein